MNYPYENLTPFTLPKLLERSLELYKDKDALGNVGKEPFTYEVFGQKIKNTIALLQQNGIAKGDKVVLLSENMPHWSVAYFAVTYFGAVIVPVLPDFHPSDVHHIIKHSEAKAVFVSKNHLPTIEDDNVEVDLVIDLQTLEILEDLSNPSYLSKFKQKITKIKETYPDENELAAIIYTSGTTGHSKGVMLSHKNLVTNAMSSFCKATIVPEDVFLSILPLAHTYECTVGMIVPILHGCSIYYLDKAPTPNILLKAFKIVRPTFMLSVPLIIEKIYKNKILSKFNSSFILKNLYKIPFFRKKLNMAAGKKLEESFGGRMRFFGIGGAALSPFVEEFLAEAKFPYIIGYGLTETSPIIAAGSTLDDIVKVRSTGTPMYGVQVKIKDKDQTTGEGEIMVRSPSVMMGYYKDEEKTAEVMDGEWFLTGDLGYLDEDGFLFISGRSKNVIIGPGGENIYPEQIESIINKNNIVLDSLVMEKDNKLIARIHLDYEQIDDMFGVGRYTEDVVSEKITEILEQMRTEVNQQLASYNKITKFIEQIEPFVKTPTKKIKRYLYTE